MDKYQQLLLAKHTSYIPIGQVVHKIHCSWLIKDQGISTFLLLERLEI